MTAVRCPDGHLNPTNLPRCRACGTPLPEHSAVSTVPRPVLGILRLSTGDTVTLDRSVLFGRNPDPHRMVAGEQPHVIRLDSPERDISRNHCEVRLEGWHVVVVDLGSSNGTVITLPGRHPVRMLPDKAAPIEPGTTVSLADVVSFVFEAAR